MRQTTRQYEPNWNLCLAWTVRSVLWFSGILAVAGFLWRSVPPTGISAGILSFALAVWVGDLILLDRFCRKKNCFDDGIPAVMMGLVLPLGWFLFYAALLGSLELTYRFRSYRKKSHLVILPREETEIEADIIDEQGEEYDEADEFDDAVQQQMVRKKTAEGRERLEGTFLVEFPAEAMTQTVHIPFCPPFDAVPSIDVFLLDEADAKLHVVKPLPFGVRIDVKRRNQEVGKLRFVIVAER